jgi:hypothetical protein
MSFLFPSSGPGKPESAVILPFPPRGPFAVRVEREQDSEGWLVIARNHGWVHGDRRAALDDAKKIAAGYGTTVRSSAC